MFDDKHIIISGHKLLSNDRSAEDTMHFCICASLDINTIILRQ